MSNHADKLYTNNIAIIRLLSICDSYSYLMSFYDYILATMQDVEIKMEGYTMDGVVFDMELLWHWHSNIYGTNSVYLFIESTGRL